MSANTRIKTEQRRNAEAAAWNTRLERGRLRPYEIAKYKVWSADPENMRALSEVQRAWDAVGALAASRSSASAPVSKLRKSRAAWGVAAALACLGVAWVLMPVGPTVTTVVKTQSEARPDYPLPDRSRVSLRPNSRLEFKMDGALRSAVVQHGEIFFDVAKDPRPFRVNVGEGLITALGTRFAVRQVNDVPSVVVEEGSVSVAHGGESKSLEAGQQLIIYPSGKMVVTPVDAKKQLAWAHTVVGFTNKTVAQLAEEFNRHNKVKIEIADARLGSVVFAHASVDLDDPEQFVAVLKTKGNIVVDRSDPKALRVSRGP
ncbi:FecR family protein [Steroidobacter flavus]|uniref:FecR family protein n=1 Tax=Steroidobacter flavus TaxID=1842136 RepID=A0ABV8SJQ3_9GAMM